MYAHRLSGINGLGEVDGFWKDVGKSLKVFGQSTIRVATAGMYDPAKNRFLVPFTGAQVRNMTTGAIGVGTMGWVGSGAKVSTDKFMNSGTGKILGNIGAAAQAAIVGGAAMNYFSAPTSVPTSVNVMPSPTAYTSAVPSASSLAPAAFADPTPAMSSLGPSGWSAGSLVPAAPVTAPTASFASIPTSANAFAPPAFGPAPALLQPFGVEAGAGGGWPSSSWLPSGDTIAKSAMTALTVADTASRILGRTASSLQTGGTVVNAGEGGQFLPTAYPTPYMPGSGGGGGNYEEPIDGGSNVMPWLAIGGVVAVVGYLYMKKK